MAQGTYQIEEEEQPTQTNTTQPADESSEVAVDPTDQPTIVTGNPGADLNAALQKMAKLGEETDLNAVLNSGADAATSLLASDVRQRQVLFELM